MREKISIQANCYKFDNKHHYIEFQFFMGWQDVSIQRNFILLLGGHLQFAYFSVANMRLHFWLLFLRILFHQKRSLNRFQIVNRLLL